MARPKGARSPTPDRTTLRGKRMRRIELAIHLKFIVYPKEVANLCSLGYRDRARSSSPAKRAVAMLAEREQEGSRTVRRGRSGLTGDRAIMLEAANRMIDRVLRDAERVTWNERQDQLALCRHVHFHAWREFPAHTTRRTVPVRHALHLVTNRGGEARRKVSIKRAPCPSGSISFGSRVHR